MTWWSTDDNDFWKLASLCQFKRVSTANSHYQPNRRRKTIKKHGCCKWVVENIINFRLFDLWVIGEILGGREKQVANAFSDTVNVCQLRSVCCVGPFLQIGNPTCAFTLRGSHASASWQPMAHQPKRTTKQVQMQAADILVWGTKISVIVLSDSTLREIFWYTVIQNIFLSYLKMFCGTFWMSLRQAAWAMC